MNLRVFISLIITLAIALQSVGVVAAATQVHQIDLEHLKTEHTHSLLTMAQFEQVQDDHNIKDCHHCGHCSGSHLSWYINKPTPTLYWQPSHNIQRDEFAYALQRHEPQFKPPRA
ncbi:hypothetical protein PSECIP111951_00214 [Pseudoalteromonas holothuriae]|uniref:DUF2946 domain-containing protein n=1 Tax=Pseudoalteromonas holothuriae TaxID=2963714 RepID=A0A9W4R0I3_9GAMM|nr:MULTISPECIES: hypothetical protein [unclassified Pseudoalteromonas]CAH9050548.1 hypothetical protein PSECIP111951_00214 [Pseudoalteromonas sp. CIP111951]CAH9061213.1 hypothetical protein PSECIP111854_02761 [Pseudoalteromonas sp. CIP111854]